MNVFRITNRYIKHQSVHTDTSTIKVIRVAHRSHGELDLSLRESGKHTELVAVFKLNREVLYFLVFGIHHKIFV